MPFVLGFLNAKSCLFVEFDTSEMKNMFTFALDWG